MAEVTATGNGGQALLVAQLEHDYPQVAEAIRVFEVSMVEYATAIASEMWPVIIVGNSSHGEK